METEHLTSKTLVSDVLAISPLVASMFIEMRLGCPGCFMVRFCTLADLCRHYQLELDEFITTLQERLVTYASYYNSDARTPRD